MLEQSECGGFVGGDEEVITKIVKEKCGNCISYLTDEDDEGNLTVFHHDPRKETGFCAMRDLFHTVENEHPSCESWIYDS